MKIINYINKFFLLMAIIIGSYFVVNGFNNISIIPVVLFTIGLGILILASLLLLLFGVEILENKLVVVVSALIPFSISLGLVYQFFNCYFYYYLMFLIIGLISIIYTRYTSGKLASTISVAFFHGIAGLIIFFMPFYLFIKMGTINFLYISIAAFFIGIGGILLIFVKAGKKFIPAELVYSLLPLILLILSVFFGLGLSK